MVKCENETVEWFEVISPREEPCPKCDGTLEYCYDATDEEWQCEDCNTRWFVPLVRAWSLMREVKTGKEKEE